MSTLNAYLTYKRNTSRLIHWLINSYNAIVKSIPLDQDGIRRAPNTTGKTTVAGVVDMAKIIAEHITPVPATVFSLLQSIIEARTAAYEAFQRIVATIPDEEIQQSNTTHKFFIDALAQAFKTPGGDAWLSSRPEKVEDEDEAEDTLLMNSFSALGLDNHNIDEEDNEGTGDADSNSASRPTDSQQQRQSTKASRKSKKGKRGKQSKNKKKASSVKDPSLDVLPLESYRIIESEAGIITNYLMATYAVVKEWIQLRAKVRDVWQEVSYNDLNGAVAASVSFMAAAMVKRTASTIFVEFPGHDSYETIMNTITRGDPDKVQGNFRTGLWRVGSEKGDPGELVTETAVDIREQFMIYTYSDLYDFVLDFQKTRSGKPTKSMLAQIRNWDPKFDLQRATNEQRIQWRRSYTINWLYDLVNVFSSIVVQRNTQKGEGHIYEKVDWSVHGPWDKHRRLFGLNGFAGDITSFAMQKPGTDIRSKILPHHVFQLQCVIDSLTISCGWSTNFLRGHALNSPSQKFRPRRDVDLFLDRDNERPGTGCLQAVNVVKVFFDKDAEIHHDPNRHHATYELLEGLQYDFINWLGESKYQHGLNTIPPSRFSNTNANGLWEYSPFLCGAGLLEGLDISFRTSMMVWDSHPEPILLMHLHNMLAKRGYIKKEIGLFTTLQNLFKNAFFKDGVAPDSDFAEAMLKHASRDSFSRALPQRLRAQLIARSTTRLDELMDPNLNKFFTNKSNLLVYQRSDWNSERIPESDIPLPTLLFGLRLRQMKLIVDPETGKKRLPDTELMARAKAEGMSDELLLTLATTMNPSDKEKDEEVAAMAKALPQAYTDEYGDYTTVENPQGMHNVEDQQSFQLEAVKHDVYSDVCGMKPILSFNYIWATARFHMLFLHIEEKLKEQRNEFYLRAYEQANGAWRNHKRVFLTMLALKGEDEECLRTMAAEFENLRMGFLDNVYWADLEETMKGPPGMRKTKWDGEGDIDCTVM